MFCATTCRCSPDARRLRHSHYREAVVDNKKSSSGYGPENGAGGDLYPINIAHPRMIAKETG